MRLHRNLHNARRGGPQWVVTVRGRVHAYRDSIMLQNVTTRVQPGGVKRCAAKGVREVVAFLDGDEIAPSEAVGFKWRWRRISFDPRTDTQFSAEGFGPFDRALYIHLRADGSSWVLSPAYEERES